MGKEGESKNQSNEDGLLAIHYSERPVAVATSSSETGDFSFQKPVTAQ